MDEHLDYFWDSIESISLNTKDTNSQTSYYDTLQELKVLKRENKVIKFNILLNQLLKEIRFNSQTPSVKDILY